MAARTLGSNRSNPRLTRGGVPFPVNLLILIRVETTLLRRSDSEPEKRFLDRCAGQNLLLLYHLREPRPRFLDREESTTRLDIRQHDLPDKNGTNPRPL